MALVNKMDLHKRQIRNIEGPASTLICLNELLAYQIGWGKRLIEWYEVGLRGQMPLMPGDGFTTFAYGPIARHFYATYLFNSPGEQDAEFQKIVNRILEIVEQEDKADRLDQENIWPWTRLASGKMWPLSKWIRVNTIAPYKRACKMIRRFCTL